MNEKKLNETNILNTVPNPSLEKDDIDEIVFEQRPRSNFFLVFCCFLAITVCGFVFFNYIASLQVDIKVKNDSGRMSKAGLVSHLKLNNANYFSIDIEKIKQLMESYRWARFVSAEKIFPNKLFIEVEERKVLARVDYSGKYYGLTDDGFLIQGSVAKNAMLSNIRVEGLDLHGYRAGVNPVIKNKKNAKIAAKVLEEIIRQRFASNVRSIDVSEAMNIKIDVSVSAYDGTPCRYMVNIGNSELVEAKIYSVRSIIKKMSEMKLQYGVLEASIPGEAVFRPTK